MGLFSYVYYSSLIRVSPRALLPKACLLEADFSLSSRPRQVNTVTPASVLQTIASMTHDQQVEVLSKLTAYIAGKGISW